MQQLLLRFVNRLRSRGLDISPGEHLDALAAVETLRLEDRVAIREALRATLVKQEEYRKVFEEEFAAFFVAPPLPRKEGRGKKAGGGISKPRETGRGPAMAERSLAHGVGGERPQSQQRPGGTQGMPSSTDHRTAQTGRAPSTEAEPGPGKTLVTFRGVQPPEAERSVQALTRTELRRLSASDVRELRRHVRTMARRLASRLSRRRTSSRRGQVDVKRTLRRSLQFGGVPFLLAHRSQKRKRPEVVVLCDVSGSVIRAGELMVEFLQALYQDIAHLRVFAFTNRVAEITGVMGSTRELSELVASAGLDPNAFSDFGSACYDLITRFPGVTGRRSTLLVMGDARNNYGDSMVWAFEEIARPARHVIWLVPEGKERWNTGDSRIADYADLCDTVAEAHTLERLLRALTTA
jgi:uncharacterized protein with von Willebrand factor type A (vWA) domain